MNISKVKRIICISFIILVLAMSSVGIVYASNASDLKNQQNEVDKKIEEKNSEIAGVKSNMTEQLTQITKLNAQISTYENEISDLEARINELNSEITIKEENINEQKEKYEVQKDLLDKRLVALYETGSTTYLDMLLSSDGLTDFISKYYTIEILAESDQELLTRIDNTRKQIENEKQELENAKSEIATSKEAVVGKKNQLASSVNKKKSIVSNLSEQEAKLEQELEEFEQDKKAIQAELAKLASNNKIPPVAPSAAGYISPLAGRTKANITTDYGAYAGHSGVDFACAGGTPIMAVKAGTVVTSTASRRPDGSYKSYGEYVIIDHHDGTVTLYAHMLSNSRAVTKGQNVSQGQVIGKVGSTGNSTGNHLHFEVRIGGRCVNPKPYLP